MCVSALFPSGSLQAFILECLGDRLSLACVTIPDPSFPGVPEIILHKPTDSDGTGAGRNGEWSVQIYPDSIKVAKWGRDDWKTIPLNATSIVDAILGVTDLLKHPAWINLIHGHLRGAFPDGKVAMRLDDETFLPLTGLFVNDGAVHVLYREDRVEVLYLDCGHRRHLGAIRRKEATGEKVRELIILSFRSTDNT